MQSIKNLTHDVITSRGKCQPSKRLNILGFIDLNISWRLLMDRRFLKSHLIFQLIYKKSNRLVQPKNKCNPKWIFPDSNPSRIPKSKLNSWHMIFRLFYEKLVFIICIPLVHIPCSWWCLMFCLRSLISRRSLRPCIRLKVEIGTS